MLQDFIKLLQQDPSPEVRIEVASSLGQLEDLRAVEPMIVVFMDKSIDVNVRAAIARSLGQLKDLRAVEPLLNSIKQNDFADAFDVQATIADALGKLEDQRAVSALAKIVNDGLATEQRLIDARLKSSSYKRAAWQEAAWERELSRTIHARISPALSASIRALGQLGGIEALDELVSMVHHGDLGTDAILALSNLNEKTAYDGTSIKPTTITKLVNIFYETGNVFIAKVLMKLGVNALTAATQFKVEKLRRQEGIKGTAEQLRYLNWFGHQFVIAELIRLAQNDLHGEETIAEIARILENGASHLGPDELSAVARLENVSQRRSVLTDDYLVPSEWSEPLDCSYVKHLAQQELSRRGLKGSP